MMLGDLNDATWVQHQFFTEDGTPVTYWSLTNGYGDVLDNTQDDPYRAKLPSYTGAWHADDSGVAKGWNGLGWEGLYITGPNPPQLNSYGTAMVWNGQVVPSGGSFSGSPDWALGSQLWAAGQNPTFWSFVPAKLNVPDTLDTLAPYLIAGLILAPVAIAVAAGAGAAEAGAAASGAAQSAGSIALDMTAPQLTGTALSDSIIAETGAGGIGNAVAGTFGATAEVTTAATLSPGETLVPFESVPAVPEVPALTGTALSDSIVAETGAGGIGNATAGIYGATSIGAVELAKTAVSAISTLKSAAGAIAAVMGIGAAGSGNPVNPYTSLQPHGLTNPAVYGTQSPLMAYWPVLALVGVALVLKGK